jgi:hypothetical protein
MPVHNIIRRNGINKGHSNSITRHNAMSQGCSNSVIRLSTISNQECSSAINNRESYRLNEWRLRNDFNSQECRHNECNPNTHSRSAHLSHNGTIIGRKKEILVKSL